MDPVNPSAILATGMAAASPPDFLAADLERLVRGGAGNDVPSYLESVATDTTTDGAKTVIRWHRLTHDATLNKPNIEKLVGKLFKQLIDFACTRSEIEEAHRRFDKDGTAEGFSALQEKARRLFTTSKKTGEVGEILLYFLAERLLRYPQVLCKMPHKTNPHVHAHGADGVHASVHPSSGHLRLHWGEAKLYQSLDAAVEDCCSSLAELLLEPADAKKTKTRDVELLRDYVDLENAELEGAIRNYLDPDNRLSNNVEFCGLALVGFDIADYDVFCTDFAAKKTAEIASRITEWSGKMNAAVVKHNLVGLTVDAFCIPFYRVQDLRTEFLKVLGVKDAGK
jgi:hypothetical protein